MKKLLLKKMKGMRDETAATLLALAFIFVTPAVYAGIVLVLDQSMRSAALIYAFSALAIASLFSSIWGVRKIIRNIGLVAGTLGTAVMMFLAIIDFFI